MLQKRFFPFFLFCLLTLQSYADNAANPLPFLPIPTPQTCQAVFYPEGSLLILPCLTIFPESEPNYQISLGLILFDESFGFVMQDYSLSQVDLSQPKNAQCIAQFLPATGEVMIPCLAVANAVTLYSATLQLNASLFSTYFSLTRFSEVSGNLNAQSKTTNTSTTNTTDTNSAAVTLTTLRLEIVGNPAVANGQDKISLRTLAFDASGKPLPNASINLEITALGQPAPLFTFSNGSSGTTAANGLFDAAITSTTDGSLQVVAVSGNMRSNAITVTFKEVTREAHALLLLHGMNSDELTWNTYLEQDERFDITTCPVVFGGVLEDPYMLSAQTTPPTLGCFRVRFGAYDATSRRVGLENLTATSPEKGDFSSFETLGKEVAEAVTALQNAYRRYYGDNVELKIALVGHSRGGLAARAFLQSDNVDNSIKSAIAAFLTTGTPHNGSPLGRVYSYLKQTCLSSNNTTRLGKDGWFSNDPCFDDWQVVDSLRYGQCNGITLSDERLDVRKPTVNDLSDRSTGISELHANADKLPDHILYGSLRYTGIDLGRLTRRYWIFDYAWIPDPCDQVSSNAQYALLEGSSPDALHLTGDGVVPYINQDFPAGFASYDKMPKSGEVFHTKETLETLHINDALKALLPAW